MRDYDRFDSMLLGSPSPAPVSPLTTRPVVITRIPVITSKRGPKYVDHTACPMCGVDRVGIEYHGELMTGAKVHTLAAHTAELRYSKSGQPRCLGAGMRVEFVEGAWRGVP